MTLESAGTHLSQQQPTDPILLLTTVMYQLHLTFSGHQDSINALGFAPDGQFLASASDDCTVVILNPWTGNIAHKLRSNAAPTSLVWDPLRRSPYRLFVGYANGRVLMATVDEVRHKLCIFSCFSLTPQIQNDFEGCYFPLQSKGVIESLSCALDRKEFRLVICVGGVVEVWTETGSCM